MSDQQERLIVALEARVRDFERNMQKAERTASKSYDGMRRGSKSATRQMQEDMARTDASVNKSLAMISGKIGAYSKAFAGGVVASLAAAGLTEIVSKIAEVTQSVADVGRQARMAGVDVEAFQELKFAAEQNRIGVDVLVDGLKELNLRADEFIATGAGSAAEAFQRMGYSSEDLAQKLKNPSALLVEIISRLGQFDRAAQIRISDEFFGGSAGERFVELVDKGAEGLREQIRYANELGLVMDKQMVAKAEEVDAKFNVIVTTVGTRLKSAIVSATSAWFEFVDKFREFENQQTATLQSRQTAIMGEKQGIAGQINEAEAEIKGLGETGSAGILREQVAELKNQLAALDDEENRIIGLLGDRTSKDLAKPKETFTPKDQSADYMREYRAELALSNRERMIAAETEKIMADAASKGASVTKEQAAALAEETVRRNESEAAARKGAAASEKAATATEAERKQVRELIAELQEELSLVWQSDVAKRAAAASRQAGAAATQQERDKIIQLNEALYQEQEAARLASERIEETKDMTKSFMFDMKDAVNSGESFWDSMGDAAVNTLDRITDKLLNEVIDALFQVNSVGKSGGGILGSLIGGLGSILGGGSAVASVGGGYDPWDGLRYAEGGIHANGRSRPLKRFAKGGVSSTAAIFGEAGPEAVVPLPDGRRIPVDLGNSGGGGGAMDVRVDVGLTIDESGNLQAVVKNISQRQINSTVGKWAKSKDFAVSVANAMPQVNSWRR